MAVYMGEQGAVQIARVANPEGFLTKLEPGDVNVERRRFSFMGSNNRLINGDRVEIRRIIKNDADKWIESPDPLELVSGGGSTYYAFIDDAGGIRLYDTFEASINGLYAPAKELVVPSEVQNVRVIPSEPEAFRCLAELRSWELTTSREQVDVDVLGSKFKQRFNNGLISGQGSLSCFWDYRANRKYEFRCEDDEGLEDANFFADLVTRTKVGGSFFGMFFLHYGGTSTRKRSVWYQCDECIVTNVAFSFEPGQPVGATIQFVTSGNVQLKVGVPPLYLVQDQDPDGLFDLEDSESEGSISLEDNMDD